MNTSLLGNQGTVIFHAWKHFEKNLTHMIWINIYFAFINEKYSNYKMKFYRAQRQYSGLGTFLACSWEFDSWYHLAPQALMGVALEAPSITGGPLPSTVRPVQPCNLDLARKLSPSWLRITLRRYLLTSLGVPLFPSILFHGSTF